MTRVTLQDIARECEVDISTVSRAMRDDPRVTEATRKRIQATARRVGYRPNLLATHLAGGRTRTIWLITPSLDPPIDYRIVRYASYHATTRDYSLFAAIHDCDTPAAIEKQSVAHYAQLVQRASQGLADGAVILPRRYGNDAELLRDLVAQKFPVVFVDNSVEEFPVPVVTTDNQGAAAELARRCVAAGAREAILLFEEPNFVARARLAAAKAALQKLGVPFVDSVQTSNEAFAAPASADVAILGSSPYYLRRFVARHEGILAGKRLVFGLFDEWIGDPAPARQVIVAVQDCETLAKRAVDRLIAQIEGKADARAPRVDLVPVVEYKTIS